MSKLLIGIIVGIISIVSAMGLGLAGGIYFYYNFESKNRNNHTSKKEKSNKIAGKKMSVGLRQSDIGSGIKQTKVSITSTTGSINTNSTKK